MKFDPKFCKTELWYKTHDYEELRHSLEYFREKLGSKLRPIGMRSSAIDLLPYLEIVVWISIGSAVKAVLSPYFQGLLGDDKLKVTGAEHRAKIEKTLLVIKQNFGKIVREVIQFIKDNPSPPWDRESDGALTLQIPISNFVLYIVLNSSTVSLNLLPGIPDGIIRAFRYFGNRKFPGDIVVLQLCVDPDSGSWRFLLAPTRKTFGRYVDRVIDLEKGEILKINSAMEFIQIMKLDKKDGNKILINPFKNEPRNQ